MHPPLINYSRRFDLSSDDYVWRASDYLIYRVAEILGLPVNSVQPTIAFTVPHIILKIAVPQSKLARLEERIKSIEAHFAKQGWLKSAPT